MGPKSTRFQFLKLAYKLRIRNLRVEVITHTPHRL